MLRKLFPLIILAMITFWFITFEVTITNAQEGKSLLTTTLAVTARLTHMPYDQQLFYGEEQRLRTSLSTGTSLNSPVRGTLGDWWADVVVGQPNFAQITPNEVVGNKLFNPGGAYVDRSTIPNKVYVYDAGNSRILGFSSLGACTAGSQMGQSCTSNSDCPGSSCTIDPHKDADLILGQLSPNSSTCNGDSGFQNYPDLPVPDASTLCGLRPENVSILEGGSMATMASDSQGNLYHADIFNNRVLRYNDPFTDDTVADHVWGQLDFTHQGCNEGRGYGQPDNTSLCLAPPVGHGSLKIGVAIDSDGNLWVSDIQNHRVLRFPYSAAQGGPAHEADLVLGQTNFSSAGWGTGPNQMIHPGSVRVDSNGKVYVLDGMDGWGSHGRLMVFNPPLSSGMAASQIFNGLGEPNGLELDPDGVLWINNSDQHKILRLINGQLQTAISGVVGHFGGFGIDRDRNILLAGWDSQAVRIYSAPGYSWTSTFLQADQYGSFNRLGPRGMNDPAGMEVTDDQLIVSDGVRMLFWNQPSQLTNNYPPADGVIGQPDFFTRPDWDPIFARMRADTHNRLWVVRAAHGLPATLFAYQLPLVSGATPTIQITSPIPLLGGGSFHWTNSVLLSGLAYQPECDCLWLSDRDYNRVFRIRNVSSGQRVVDVVLGQKRNPTTLEIGTQCNQGRDPEGGHPSSPSQDSLCHPGPLALDRHGNLFVSDHNLEIAGNWRLLEFDAASIPLQPTTPVFAIPASRVYGRNGSFTQPNCQPSDPICGPWEPVFYPNNDMVIGFNGYLGPHFPQVYHDPLTNPVPYAALRDFYSHAYSARLDSRNNLYILDLTRSRVLIYKAATHIPTATQTPTSTNTNTPTATPTSLYNPLYLSLTGNQTIGGISSADEDILRFDGQTWSLFFDGSDVGVGSLDLFAFSIVDTDTILMSFDKAITIAGLAIAPQDVVRFDAASLGSTTAGTFSMYLDGSDVGLDVSAEKIDAVSLLSDGRVLISTTGNPAVSGVTGGRDEDVLAFTSTSLGNITSGTWAMYFDGSDVGLSETSGEDVDALDVANGKIYLSALDNFAVPGVAGADEDVFVCNAALLGDITVCDYSAALYFDGSTWGLAANDVDAFQILALGPVPNSTPTHTPTATNTPTPTATSTAGPSPTTTDTPTVIPTPTETNTPSELDLIFADGFEAGNLSAWTSSSIDAGDLSASGTAALIGSQGLQALLDDNTAIFVTDDSPNAESRYRVRFYFDPNSMTMASGDAFFLFKGFAGTSTDVLQAELRKFSAAYQIRVKVLNDSSAFVNTSWFTISDVAHFIELDWRAATAAGANNGGVTLWIDGVQQADLTTVDNDTWRIDRARLGAVAGIDTGTRGTVYFDAFESQRQNYIGP